MPVICVAYQSKESINKSHIEVINYWSSIFPTEPRWQSKEVLDVTYTRNWKYNINAYKLYLCVF